MRFSYAESMCDPFQLAPLAQAAEEAGYDSVTVPDSICFPKESSTEYPYNKDGNREFLLGKPFVKVTWASHIDETGRPVRNPGVEPTREGVLIYPGVQGGTNWYSPSFSPRTGLFYVPTWDNYSSSFVKLSLELKSAFTYTRSFGSAFSFLRKLRLLLGLTAAWTSMPASSAAATKW